MDVGDWLRSLGLGEYEAAFRENAIDGKVLPKLTAEDLKDLGVAIVGHRRTMLSAIEALSAPSDVPAKAAEAAVLPPQAPPRQSDAERRHLAVLFCDLVGSTGISAALDAEDWRDLVGAYLDASSAAVTEMGGHVAKKLGDGIMALFGHPTAQENDSERAVRAALAIQLALAELNRKKLGSVRPELVARIGIAAGAVVVDSSGEIFGDAPNIAARVQALAEPGTVLVTARVQRQVAGLFVVEDRGPHALKGVAEPTTLFRIVRASGGGRRSGQRTLTPLVGRDEEVTMLLRRWERARQGEGQFVTIVGEPGLGKSRLIEEFRGRLADTPHTWVEWSSSQLLQNTPLHPIADWGRLRFGGADVAPERRLAELETTLAQVKLDPAEYVPLLAPLVDIPLPLERASGLAPEELRRRQMAAILAWFAAGARTQPVVLAFEDLHWADPTTLDLMRGFAERGALAPLLVVATARPEFRAPWGARSHHGTITLAPLDRAQVRQMVGELAQRHALSRETVDGVSERTGGVPLFIEEVTRLLLERGEQGGAQAIPPTLQQSLAARLDRLGPAREVAMIGAVLGRGFSFSLLLAVAGLEEARLHEALEKLAEADILLVEGLPPDADYRFKHALIQDAAYENLLKSRRLALHRRAAETLRDQFAARAEAEPEALAHHFTRAGLTDAAIEYWGKAGDQALRRSAFQEAIAHLGKAIEMADKGGEGAPRTDPARASTSHRLKLQADYSQAMMWSRGFGAKETEAAFNRARELATSGNDTAARATTAYGLWVGRMQRGELEAALDTAASLFGEAESEARLTETSIACRMMGLTLLFQGHFAEAQANLARALDLYDPERDRDTKFHVGMDTAAGAAVHLGFTYWLIGDFIRARQLVDEAVGRAATSGHPPTLVITSAHRSLFEVLRGDAAAARQAADTLFRLGQEHGIVHFQALGALHSGWALARGPNAGDGGSELRQALANYLEQGNKWYAPFFQGLLAEIEAEGPDLDAALSRIDEALAIAAETVERWTDAVLHRVRGEILFKREPGNPAPAEEAFLAAIAIAREQGARSFGLQAALKLAKLYQSTGRPVEAHDALAPALEDFSPTPEMPEIAEAQALPAGLAETDQVKAETARRHQRRQLQVAFGNALIAARGPSAPDTTEAFARARERGLAERYATDRVTADFGLWLGSYFRGDLPSMRAHAETLSRDVEARPDSAEAGVAHRVQGINYHFAGDYVEAQRHLDRALTLFEPGRDDDLTYRLGVDAGVAAMALLAFATWPLGEVDRAISLIDRMTARAATLAHTNARGFGAAFACVFGLLSGDVSRAASNAAELSRLVDEHDLPMWRAFGLYFERLATAQDGALGDMRRGVELLREQNVLVFDGLLKIALAEAEARAGDVNRAVVVLDEALATCERTGYRAFEAELHRVRGEMLAKRDPANPAQAEEVFQTAIAVAKQQGTRSFELRAALALAKLYQSTGRLVEAYGALAPALKSFSPTPEMPEIAEAQELLDALANDEGVREALERRNARVKMHVDYARAIQWAKGWGSEEARAAIERAHEFAAPTLGHPDYWSLTYGRFAVSLLRGEFRAALEIAETYLRQAQVERRPDHAVNARRLLGTVKLELGAFSESRRDFEELLANWDEERDKHLRVVTGADALCVGWAYMAQLMMILGEVEEAVKMSEDAIRRAEYLGDFGSLAFATGQSLPVLATCGRVEPVLRRAEAFEANASQKGAQLWESNARGWASWARGLITGDAATAATEFREIMAAKRERRERQTMYIWQGLLAQLQDKAGASDDALASIAEGLALAEQTGGHRADSFLCRVRGDILAERDPAAAEAAYRGALRIAQAQGARTFELQTAHALAKLLYRAGRLAEAHAILAPALEGIAPTPEMPEIAEAQRLLSQLA